MRLVDAHCHLNSDRLQGDVAEVVRAAAEAGVETLVMAGVDAACWRSQQALATRFPGVARMVFGLHPQVVAELDRAGLDKGLAELERMARGEPALVAVGETGLDRFTPERRDSVALQEESMRAHFELADAIGRPVVLHLLKAHDDALRVLKDARLPAAGGVVHSFSGSAELARAYVKLGLHVSFCGSLTWPQSRRLRAAAAEVPLDRVLVETDSPDQTPHPHQGEANRPALLPLVAQALADVHGVDVAEIARRTTENATRFYSLSSS